MITSNGNMGHNLQETIALLSRTPATLDIWLRGLPEIWTNRSEGEGTFTALDVVGHLIYTDREDWLPRAHKILEFGEAQPFDPFDRKGHVKESAGKSLDQLLDEFTQVRAEALDHLRSFNLQPEDLERRGRHPALGAVTMSELLATWAGHDLTHLHQLSRIMASQYREAVGPFADYLGVMKCGGHGT
ncbi:MAG TPA: DinB family protein [Terriglobales bacterium]|nr:DinB family protein [Terriglobales bacterium]